MTRRATSKNTPHDRDFQHQLESCPLLLGREIEVDTTASAVSAVYQRHGLGRRMRNVLIGAQSSGGIAQAIHPESLDTLGYDPAVYFGITFSSATAAKLLVWVY